MRQPRKSGHRVPGRAHEHARPQGAERHFDSRSDSFCRHHDRNSGLENIPALHKEHEPRDGFHRLYTVEPVAENFRCIADIDEPGDDEM